MVKFHPWHQQWFRISGHNLIQDTVFTAYCRSHYISPRMGKINSDDCGCTRCFTPAWTLPVRNWICFKRRKVAFNPGRFLGKASHRYWTQTCTDWGVLRDWSDEDRDCVNVLLGADVLLLLGVAGDLPDADSVLNVFELQTQVLAGDGQHGSSLPGPRLWKQLDDRGHMLAGTTCEDAAVYHSKWQFT